MLVFDKKYAVKFSNLFFDQIVGMADSHELLDKTGHSINKRFADQLITKACQNQAHVFPLANKIYSAELSVVPDSDCFFVFFDDVSHLKEVEENYEHQTQVLQTIVDAIPQYVFWKSGQSVFDGCNQVFAESANFMNPSQVVGLTDYHMPWKDSADKYIKDDLHVIQGHKPLLGYDEWQESADGIRKIMKVDKIPVFTKDKTSIVCLYIDNTENHMLKKNVEEATMARNLSEKVMSDFILNMQHDIRTPLAGIVGLGDVVLSMGPEDMSDIHGAVKDMVNSASRLLTYCESMVDLHKIQDEVDHTEPEPTSIDDLVCGIFEIEKPAADAKGIQIIHNTKPSGIRCIVNKNKLERVLVNLVSNAIKFTEKGQVEIISELIQNEKSRDALLRIKVKDSGIGIDESDLDYVFQQFSKLKPSYSDTVGGLTLGFGLRLAKIFVNELGGDISLDSKKGSGSTFTVDVPVRLPLTCLYNVTD